MKKSAHIFIHLDHELPYLIAKEEQHAHWREIIEGQRTSGITIAAYCRENQIPTTSFYTTRRRLKEWEAVTGGFLELKTARLVAPASSGIHLRFGNNLYVEVERGGRAAALFMSLVKSCKDLDINPWEYFDDMLRWIMSHPVSRLRELLPDVWKPLPKDKRGLLLMENA